MLRFNTTNNAWQAIVFTEGRTTCGMSEGVPEALPGLYATAQEAQAAASSLSLGVIYGV